MTRRTDEEMAVRPMGFRRFFNQRFVQAVEVFGYLVCAMIALGLAYAVWAKVDIVVQLEGVLIAPSTAIYAPGDVAVTAWAVEAGQPTEAGALVYAYVSDPAQRDTARARTLIAGAMEALKGNHSATQAAADHCARALEALPAVEGEVRVTSPTAGIAVPSPLAALGATVPQDTVVARVVDVTRLQLEGSLTGNAAAQVEEGNPVRVTDPLSGKDLVGEVARVERENVTANVVLAFVQVPNETAEAYEHDVLNPDPASPPARVRARIVVGQQSLFKSVFGRR